MREGFQTYICRLVIGDRVRNRAQEPHTFILGDNRGHKIRLGAHAKDQNLYCPTGCENFLQGRKKIVPTPRAKVIFGADGQQHWKAGIKTQVSFGFILIRTDKTAIPAHAREEGDGARESESFGKPDKIRQSVECNVCHCATQAKPEVSMVEVSHRRAATGGERQNWDRIVRVVVQDDPIGLS